MPNWVARKSCETKAQRELFLGETFSTRLPFNLIFHEQRLSSANIANTKFCDACFINRFSICLTMFLVAFFFATLDCQAIVFIDRRFLSFWFKSKVFPIFFCQLLALVQLSHEKWHNALLFSSMKSYKTHECEQKKNNKRSWNCQWGNLFENLSCLAFVMISNFCHS